MGTGRRKKKNKEQNAEKKEMAVRREIEIGFLVVEERIHGGEPVDM